MKEHKKEISKLKIKQLERSHKPSMDSNADDLQNQMADDMININDIINIQ